MARAAMAAPAAATALSAPVAAQEVVDVVNATSDVAAALAVSLIETAERTLPSPPSMVHLRALASASLVVAV